MPLIPKNEGKFYLYADKDNEKRTACMYFNKEVGNSKWELQKCDTVLRQDPHSIEDWDFLGEIAEMIKEKLAELNEEE